MKMEMNRYFSENRVIANRHTKYTHVKSKTALLNDTLYFLISMLMAQNDLF